MNSSNYLAKTVSKSDQNLEILKAYDYEIVYKYMPETNEHKMVFKCTYHNCNKLLETSWNMLDHARMHKGIKPYKCAYCSKTFTQKGNMRKHAKLHMTATVQERRKFQCRLCPSKFTEGYNLLVRMKSSN